MLEVLGLTAAVAGLYQAMLDHPGTAWTSSPPAAA